jgi:hypothetical protein
MSINAMRAFGHPLKRANNHESELGQQSKRNFLIRANERDFDET